LKERVEKVLAEVAAMRQDRRLHCFDVQADPDAARTIKLSGKVLESSDLQALLVKMDGVNVDASAVQVLRHQPAAMRYVATNLTELHREPGWISELMTQLTLGTSMEILEEKDRWAFVRLESGYLGWAYRSYMTDTAPSPATHLVNASIGWLYPEPSTDAIPASRLSIGTAVRACETREIFSRVELAGSMLKANWIVTEDLIPLTSLPLSADRAAAQMIDDAVTLKGVHYLWGGTTSYGIDCSGLCQLVHKLAGYTIPRDADLQFAAGKPVEPPYQPGDLMFFGGEPAAHAPRKITHVGLSLGGWRIIHSSRSNNGVYEDDIQAVEHLRASFCGARTFIR
jgi:cell wall-associated NlpC family hydrolase